MLAVGFGGLLVLLGLSGLDSLSVLAQIRSRNAVIRRDYVERSRSLEQIRAMLYLSGTFVRDYLLEPDAAKAETFRLGLAGIRRQIDSRLTAYGGLLHPEEQGPFLVLRRELGAYWRSLDPVLAWSPPQRRREGYAFLRDEVFPRRTGMLSIADRIAAVNDRQLDDGDRRLAVLFASFRRRLTFTLGATLALGVLLAALAMRRILSLEAETAVHLTELVRARTELKDLSARLVAAQESERKAIARELHDGVGQVLSAALMELRNVAAWLATPAEAATLRTHLDTVRTLVEGAVDQARNMALMLRPSMLDDLGLVPALQWQGRETSRRTGMLVHVAAEELPEDLPDDYRTCIYRLAQEALANCSKHSAARTVWVTLQGMAQPPTAAGGFHLAVQDDGIGFDTARDRGLGLLGMQERVATLGGELRVASAPGRGTLLTATLPMPVPAPMAAALPAAADRMPA